MDNDPARAETDHYDALGVSPDATEAEIARAYRRLAREMHPDANPGDPGAEERFKAVGAAHDVVGDPVRRAAYDRERAMAARGARRRPDGSYAIRVENLDDVDRRAELRLPFVEAVTGTTRVVPVPGAGPTTVRIPAGVDDGQTIRVPGRGRPGRRGGRAGDLLVTVHVEPHPLFGRAGADLTLTVPVTFAEAVRGTAVAVPTLDGDPVAVRIPAGTPPGRTLRVRGCGAPRPGGGRGDLLVTVQVDVPRRLSDRQRALVDELARLDDPHALRAHLGVGP